MVFIRILATKEKVQIEIAIKVEQGGAKPPIAFEISGAVNLARWHRRKMRLQRRNTQTLEQDIRIGCETLNATAVSTALLGRTVCMGNTGQV